MQLCGKETGLTEHEYFAGGYWAVWDAGKETLVYVLQVLPWGAVLKVRTAEGWRWQVYTSEVLGIWNWRPVDVEEANAWPVWKLQ